MKKLLSLFMIALLSTVVLNCKGKAKRDCETKVCVVTTNTDMASLVGSVGGDMVSVESLAAGTADLHFVKTQPSFVETINQSKVLVMIGLGMEMGWLPYLLKQVNNEAVKEGGEGHVDGSTYVEALEKGVIKTDDNQAFHSEGNPHYWSDAVEGVKVAEAIKNTLSKVDSANADAYQANYDAFKAAADKVIADNAALMEAHKGKKVVAYHREFSYLANRYGLEIVSHIEEQPGATPGPEQSQKIVNLMKEQEIKHILISPWSKIQVAQQIADQAGAKLVILPLQTGAPGAGADYLATISSVAKTLSEKL